MELFRYIKKMLSMGAIEPNQDSPQRKSSKITNKLLLNELVTHFEQSMNELSVGRRILYPMSFNILMHPDDYNSTKESLPFVLPEVVSQFYSVIKKEKNKYADGVNYSPPATYWFFQFSACQIVEDEVHDCLIERGKIITTGSLTTFDILSFHDTVHSETNIQLSVKCQNSNTNANNINLESLLGIDILSEGTYKFQFDKSLNEDTSTIALSSKVNNNVWATLSWMEGTLVKSYKMLDTYIDISGNIETRHSRNICIINSDAVALSHVQIRYDQSTQSFQLAAFAKTRLNSREVPISISGTPIWISLPKFNSRIFLNDAISVEFNANHDLV